MNRPQDLSDHFLRDMVGEKLMKHVGSAYDISDFVLQDRDTQERFVLAMNEDEELVDMIADSTHWATEFVKLGAKESLASAFSYMKRKGILYYHKGERAPRPGGGSAALGVIALPAESEWNKRSPASKVMLIIHECTHLLREKAGGVGRPLAYVFKPWYRAIEESNCYAASWAQAYALGWVSESWVALQIERLPAKLKKRPYFVGGVFIRAERVARVVRSGVALAIARHVARTGKPANRV